MNEGDWICTDSQCSNVNFARRTTCNRCGKDKTAIPSRKILGHEIGKAAAEKSRGLFSADDWQCGRCGNVNWARRQSCNMCNAPKFGEVEERTGLGGGYNERENVEYIEREESDGEYDEFGRKKKKYRGNDEENPKDVPVKEENVKLKELPKQVDEDEEEDDDDDDDGDLSKYDLSGWGDDDEEPSKTDKKQSSKSPSSASSRSASSRSSSSSSRSSQSSHSSSGSEKRSKNKRHYSRSRSNSPEVKRKKKQTSSSSSRSPTPSSRSRSRDRSTSSQSPASRKR